MTHLYHNLSPTDAIKEAADTLPSPSRSLAVRQMSEIEENAIMYAAGYVVRVLMEKYKEAVGPVAADFMACLLNMLEGSSLDIEQNESFKECAARWVKLTNRGGLLILRQGAYWLFRDIELLLWPLLHCKYVILYLLLYIISISSTFLAVFFQTLPILFCLPFFQHSEQSNLRNDVYHSVHYRQ